MSQKTTDITQVDFFFHVRNYRGDGWRLVQIHCNNTENGFEILYSFGKGLDMEHLRLPVAHGESVPSITPAYPPAFMYENEIHDLFGIPITHIAIDYQGNLIKTSVKAPFAKAKEEDHA